MAYSAQDPYQDSEEEYRQRLRDLILSSGGDLSGRQTLPDGTIVGFASADSAAKQRAIEEEKAKSLSELASMRIDNNELGVTYGGMNSHRPATLANLVQPQEQSSPQYQPSPAERKAQIGNGFRNESTGAQYAIPSNPSPVYQGQRGAQSGGSSADNLINLGQRQNIPRDQLSAMIQYQASAQPGAPSAEDLYRQSFRFGIPIKDLIAAHSTMGAGDSARIEKDLKIAKARQELSSGEIESQVKRAQLDQLTRGGQGIPKLEKGEVWNAEAGRVDAAPGSSRFITQQGKFAADKKALDAVVMKAQGAVDKVDEILGPGGTENPGDGFKSNFGGYNAYLTQYLPGEASDKRKKIDSLKSDLRAAGLEMMRSGGSIGAMTEREWPIVEQMMAGISPVLSEMEAAFQLAKVKTKMQQIRVSAQEDYDTSWRNTQFGAQGPAAGPTVGATVKRDLSPQDAQALAWAAGNPGDPRAAQINAKLGVK